MYTQQDQAYWKVNQTKRESHWPAEHMGRDKAAVSKRKCETAVFDKPGLVSVSTNQKTSYKLSDIFSK